MKTVIEMAKEAGNDDLFDAMQVAFLERLVELVRAEEREACAKECETHTPPSDEYESPLVAVYNAILARRRHD